MATAALVGLISDTHGHLDPRVYEALEGVDVILHAGDVCGDSILFELQAIAPRVVAVRGNCDVSDGAWSLSHVERTTIAGARFLVIHDLKSLRTLPDDVDVVVHGHTHRPSVTSEGAVLLVNPGSASQRRRMPSRSVAIARIGTEGDVDVRTIMLDAVSPPD